MLLRSVKGIYGGDLLDGTKYRALLHSNGSVLYWVSGKTKTLCRLDLSYFPFDQQACYVELDSWTYNQRQVNISCKTMTLESSLYRSNEQWHMFDARVSSLFDLCSAST
jgi:hypothetical protein